MTDKDLKKLSRADLLEMLIEQTKQRNALEVQLNQLQQQIESREICISQAGSIAEAALQLNHIFDAAQQAAQQYLDNIERLHNEQDTVFNHKREEAEAEAKAIREQAKQEAAAIIEAAQQESDTIHREADDYWKDVTTRLERFYDDHKGLRELLKYMEVDHEKV